jgi:hypothetical protein
MEKWAQSGKKSRETDLCRRAIACDEANADFGSMILN